MNARRTKPRLAVSVFAAAAFLLGAVVPAAAHGSKERYRVDLDPVRHARSADEGSNVHGTVKITRFDDETIRVVLKARNASAELPHAVHIHGHEAADEIAQCPGRDRRDDLVDDGLIETLEGLPDYGGILVSFTTEGDTSPDSALALDRFPVARENEKLRYRRTFDIPESIADRLTDFHVVVHGEDLDGDGEYGGRTTDLGAPLEAELPVACGRIVRR